jgi:hypothetical protein
MTSDVVRRVVKDATYDIINNEFINEFQSSVSNIRSIVEAFQGLPQTLDHDDVLNVLSLIEFKDATGARQWLEQKEKLGFLYEIGFLGFEVDEKIRNRFGIQASQAFYFNEGYMLLNLIASEMLAESRFVIHPLFVEYLNLDTSRQNLTLNFTWNYLKDMEAVLHV